MPATEENGICRNAAKPIEEIPFAFATFRAEKLAHVIRKKTISH